MSRTQIVILGGGFAGIQTALKLSKSFKTTQQISLTLISEHDYFLFTPNLFEVASAPLEFTSMRELKKSISLPINEILRNTTIRFIKAQADSVNIQERKVILKGKFAEYDYLILALGSHSEYFRIKGAQEFSLTLNNLKEALLIRHRLEFLVAEHAKDMVKKNIRIVVAGGGYTAVELVGELQKTLNILCWKYGYLRQRIEIEIIEARNMLMPGFNEKMSQDVQNRLKQLGVRVNVLSPIERVERNSLNLLTGKKIDFDLLIWTVGIHANKINGTEDFATNSRGQLAVDEYLRVKGQNNIFAVGDMAEVLNEQGKTVPASAQDAWDQARYLSKALPDLKQNKKPAPFKPIPHGFIVNVSGKWAIMSYKGIYLKGYLAYLMDKLAHFRFYMDLVGFRKAFKYIFTEIKLYGRND